MTTTTCTRRLEWDAGHRVLGHQGKCRALHGHRYAAEVTVEAGLDALGMVVDFALVKQRVGGWIDDYLDHNLILHRDDPLTRLLMDMTPQQVCDPDGLFGGKLPYVIDNWPSFTDPRNPTAEVLAQIIYGVATNLLHEFKVVSVTVWETPNCSATYRPDKEG